MEKADDYLAGLSEMPATGGSKPHAGSEPGRALEGDLEGLQGEQQEGDDQTEEPEEEREEENRTQEPEEEEEEDRTQEPEEHQEEDEAAYWAQQQLLNPAKEAKAEPLPTPPRTRTAVPTPARGVRAPGAQKPPASTDQEPPSLTDKQAARPAPGECTLSPEALRSRTKRIFTPRANGTLKVSPEVFKDWHKGRGSKERRSLELIFQQCGYDPDRLGDVVCLTRHLFQALLDSTLSPYP